MFIVDKEDQVSLFKIRIEEIENNKKITLSDKKQLTRFFKKKLKEIE